MAPIAPGIKISEIEFFLQTELDSAQCARDLARDECFAPSRRFVIEENSVADEEIVRLPLVDGVPMGCHFAHGIRAARVEGRLFVLRWRRGPEHFRGSSLVKSRLSSGFTRIVTKRFQQAQRACRHDVRSILRLIEAHAHVGLRTEIVDLVGLDLVDQTTEVSGVCQVAVVQDAERSLARADPNRCDRDDLY